MPGRLGLAAGLVSARQLRHAIAGLQAARTATHRSSLGLARRPDFLP